MDRVTVSHQRWQDHWLFLSHFRKSPRTVGAIAPSSQRLARTMVDGLDLEGAVRVVELGPGTGAVTGEIARRLPAHALCLAIDIDPVFSSRVAARWPQLDSVCGQAEHLVEIARTRGLLPIDHIVSGLPFASLPTASARDCRRHRHSLTPWRNVYDISIRPRVRFSFSSGRPAHADRQHGLGAEPEARAG